MEWNRSETIALAAASCTQCHGLGLRIGKRGRTSPCQCVMRAIFRACYRRFRECATKERHMTQAVLEYTGGPSRRRVWGRKEEEYTADFLLIAKRTLNPAQHRIFRLHFLLGADWSLCCRQLKLDRGEFFHEIYRIEALLGRTFRELEPYALFPVDQYFNGAAPDTPVVSRLRKIVQFERGQGGGLSERVPLATPRDKAA